MAILTNINLILQLLFLCVLYTLWNIFHENEQGNERNFIIAMSVTELPLIGWSIIKMIFNDLISDGSIRSFLNFHKSKVLGIIWVPKRFNTKSTDFFTCSKKNILMIDHPIRGSSVTDIAMIKFLSFSCSFSWKMFHSVYNNCNNNNCKMRLMLVKIAIYFRK